MLLFVGATGGDGMSADGLTMTAFLSSGKQIACRAGRKFGMLHSVFEAKLLALDWGIVFSGIFCMRFDQITSQDLVGSFFNVDLE